MVLRDRNMLWNIYYKMYMWNTISCEAGKKHILFKSVYYSIYYIDRLCGLVVRVLGYRSGGPGSIPGTTRKKKSGTGSTQLHEYNWGATWQKSSGFCLENREYGRRDPSCWPRGTLYPQKLAVTSPTSGGRSVGIVHLRTQTMEFFMYYI
jgi:hypothetical protein